MTSMDPKELVQRFPLFDLALATYIHENAECKIFKPGEQLMRPGQFFKYAMLVVSGRVKLYREGEDGDEFFMYFIEEGSACALSMLCMARSQSSTVMATVVEEATVIMIPIQYMDTLMRDYPSWYMFVVETYRFRFEELLSVVDQIAFKNMDQRLLWYLSRQAEAMGNEINLTHQQIATDLNSSREVISRLLKKLEKNGQITAERNTIRWKGNTA